LLLGNIGLLSAQETSTDLTAFHKSPAIRLSGPSASLSPEAGPSGNTRKALTLSQRKTYFRLGERLIAIQKQVTDESAPFVVISLHHNEEAVSEAARRFVLERGGTFLELLNAKQRNIEFSLFEKEMNVDPNRIFTPRGRNQDLSINRKTDMIIAHQLNTLAQFFIGEIPTDKTIISVHSNDPGEYGISEYADKGDRDRDAYLVYRNPSMKEGNFFVTTSRQQFFVLKEKGFNVVLQSVRCKDDGSLGVFCGRTRRAYIGIETLKGEEAEQQRMIETVAEMLR